jgi:urease accessory protein
MLELIERVTPGQAIGEVGHTLTLPFDQRQKSRFRAELDAPPGGDRREAFVILERGQILRHRDILRAADGTLVRVLAAREALSVVSSREPLALLRAAYHLGNRHVQLQVERYRLAYQHDHVLDAMVQSLGLQVGFEEGPFEPEAGAYGNHSHAQGRQHGHDHSHGHDHHGHAHPHHAGHRHPPVHEPTHDPEHGSHSIPRVRLRHDH